MKDCEYHDAASLSLVVNAVGKPFCKNATNAVMHNGKEQWPLCCKCNAAVNFCDELSAKVGVPYLIPRCRLNELIAGSTTERDRETHLPIWASADALTSLHGTTSLGFAS